MEGGSYLLDGMARFFGRMEIFAESTGIVARKQVVYFDSTLKWDRYNPPETDTHLLHLMVLVAYR